MTSRTGFSRWWGAACGLVAAAAAMGIGQLFAGFTVPAASPVVAVGEAAIDRTPLAVKDWATSTFGTADKAVLLAGVLVVVFLYSMVVGVLAMRRLALGFLGLAIFAGIGLAAALTRHNATGSYVVPTLFGAIAGALALWWLVVTARRAASARAAAGNGAGDGGREAFPAWTPAGQARRSGRRQFLVAAGVGVAAAAIGEFGGRSLATRKNVSAARQALRFPRAAVPAPALPAGVNLPVPGLSSFITPNGQFYRVDTALIVPQVDPSNWRLRIHGMVSREVVITFDELLRGRSSRTTSRCAACPTRSAARTSATRSGLARPTAR